MSQTLNEQISEAFTTVIKKANIFEKISELKNSVRGLIFFSGLATSVIFINVFSNLRCKIQDIETMNNMYFQKINENQNNFENTIDKLNNKMDDLIEVNKALMNELSSKIDRNETNEKETNINEPNINENIRNKTNKTNKTINTLSGDDDDELLNECYDNIPCNNIKKATGINRIFGL